MKLLVYWFLPSVPRLASYPSAHQCDTAEARSMPREVNVPLCELRCPESSVSASAVMRCLDGCMV